MTVWTDEPKVVRLVVPLVPIDVVDFDPQGLSLPDGREFAHAAFLSPSYLDQGPPKVSGLGSCACIGDAHEGLSSGLAVRRNSTFAMLAREVLEGEPGLHRPTFQPYLH